jgi:hypothetical protein
VDTHDLGLIIFFLASAVGLGGLVIWLVVHSLRKVSRVYRANTGVESSVNRLLSFLTVLFFAGAGLMLLLIISSDFDRPQRGEICTGLFVLGAILGFMIRPVIKPDHSPSRLSKHSIIGWPARHKWISIFLGVAILALATYAYQLIAVQLNKHQFEQARAAIDIVYADIVNNVGPPDNSKRENSCSRLSREFEREPIVCVVQTGFLFGVSGLNDANEKTKTVQAEISKHKRLFAPIQSASDGISPVQVASSIYQDTEDHYRSNGIDCSVKYVFDTPQETYLNQLNTDLKPLYIRIMCSDLARQEYYSLH